MNGYFNRDLSWLSFNERVLQEAEDKSVPLFERLKFLAIFSSNLEEFFRVRVAFIRSAKNLNQKEKQEFDFNPGALLKKIHKKVFQLQERFGFIYNYLIVPELSANSIFLLKNNELNNDQLIFTNEYFLENVLPLVNPILLVKKKVKPFLKTGSLYLAVKLSSITSKKESKKKRFTYALVEIPSEKLDRFVSLPSGSAGLEFIFLDDLIRNSLNEIFSGYRVEETVSVKLTRDAELHIDDEFSGNLLDKIKKNLNKRSTGVPCRFLYDKEISFDFLKFLKDSLMLGKDDLIPGARYHNFSDFFKFPFPKINKLSYEPLEQIINNDFSKTSDCFDLISDKDVLLLYPYYTYQHLVDFFNTASLDEYVREIKITVYRVAVNSQIMNSLLSALKNGIRVTIFVEIKARFDEALNIKYAEQLMDAGAVILYSIPGLKVHAKMALISREENGSHEKYCYLSTGNFNEKTSSVYSDFGFFTKDKRITEEIDSLFKFLENPDTKPEFKNLLTAQFNMKKEFSRLIKNEILNSKAGRKSYIILKLNSLEDKKMISLLYEASAAGVRIDVIVRGICCLIPGVKGMSENINVISIVDRFLEHSRVFIFCNNDNPLVYLSSADWMKRNLNRRIETAFPVYDEKLKNLIRHVIELQLNDNVKTRIIDRKQINKYKTSDGNSVKSSLERIFEYLKSVNSNH